MLSDPLRDAPQDAGLPLGEVNDHFEGPPAMKRLDKIEIRHRTWAFLLG
ncbi:hypothetical protein [Streptomyces sp. NPDC001820]